MSRPRWLLGLAALVALAVGLGGCRSNQQRSAELEKQAKKHVLARATGLQVTRQNPNVRVLSTMVLHAADGTAALVTLRNESARPLRDVPIALTVSGASGAVLYRNTAAGLDSTLTSVPLLLPHRQFTWIDDQVQVSGAPTAVSALVGEAPSAPGTPPQLVVRGTHLSEEAGNGTEAAGQVHNASGVTQQKLVVYAIARRAGRIVAAGKAVLPEIPARSSTPFQIFFIGDPRGGTLELTAPASTFG